MFWLFGSAFCVREASDADAHEAYARDIAQTATQRLPTHGQTDLTCGQPCILAIVAVFTIGATVLA